MKAFLLVVALAVIPACGQGNDIAALQHEAVTLTKYYRPKLESLDKRIGAIFDRGKTIPGNLPGIQDVGRRLQEARETLTKLHELVEGTPTTPSLDKQAEAAAKEGNALELEKIVDESEEALAAARARNVPIRVVRAGTSFRLGRLRVHVLWPEDEGTASEDPNQNAVVLVASYGETDVFLSADAESDVTSRLRLGPVEVMKVAHHGSEDAGLSAELETLRPRVAVISCGRNNDYGHPRPGTLAALEASPGLSVYRTDEDGRVVVESDGHELTVRTDR